MVKQTLVLIKPDGVQRSVSGEIITRFENAGMKIIGMKMVWVDKKLSKEHYSEHVKKPFFKGLDEFIRSGPVIAIVVEGVDAVKNVRRIVGSTAPGEALPGTIRGDYAHHTYEYADRKGKSIANLIHASGSEDEAKKEISLWFDKSEIHTYKRADEHIVF
ncbi:MAG: nucleoside-diphosphate kinase [Candidatus Woesearchaeota archaeon]|jgi:nucleoside-diphosphate kinase